MRVRALVRIMVVIGIAAGVSMCKDEEAVGHESTLVGGPCVSDDDCDDRCVQGGDFPGGMCTVPCHDDSECPDGSVCIDKEGGVCLQACEVDTDCRGAYECDSQGRVGQTGEATVCVDD